MFCEKCGSPVGESEKFCSQCGAPIPQEEATAEPAPVEVKAEEAKAAEATAEPAPVEVKAEEAKAAEATAEPAPMEAKAEEAKAAEATAEPAPVEVKAEEAKAAEAAAEPAPVEAAAPTPLSVPQMQEAPIAPAIPADKPDTGSKKPKKKKAPWIIAACVLAALAAVCVVNAASLGNFFRRTFSSPEKYYQYVEKATVQELAEQSGSYYETLLAGLTEKKEYSADAEFAIELGEGGQELIQMLETQGVDLTWLKGLSIGIGWAMKDNLLGYDATLGLNSSDILSLRAILDPEEDSMYLQMPELSKEYIGFDMYEYSGTSGEEILELYQEEQELMAALEKILPEAKDAEKLLQKYLLLALSGVNDVEKRTETIEAGDIRQKCTELEVTFDGKALSEILEKVLKEIPKDKELKKLFVSIVDGLMETEGLYSVMDGEYLWEMLTEEIEDALDSLDELEDVDDVLVMKVYVDGKGKIIGRVLELVEGRDTYATISSLFLEKGGKFGIEFSVQPGSDREEGIELTGSGRKSGNKLTGDFEIAYAGMRVLDMKVSELDTGKLAQGYLNGSVQISFSKEIARLLSESLSAYGTMYASMLADMQLTLDFQMAENTGKITLGLSYDEKKLGSISMAVNVGDGSELKVPNAGDTVFFEDEEDLADWLEKVDWNGFIQRLKQAELPEEVTGPLEEFVEMLDLYGIYGPFFDYDDSYGGYDWDDYYGDDSYGWDDYYGDDSDSDDSYGGYGWDDWNIPEANGSLEELLQSEEWQDELTEWNESVIDMGIMIETVADGDTLVFLWWLPDDELFGNLTADQCESLGSMFLDTLAGADFLSLFETGYGIRLDGVRVVFIKSDGTEIYQDEIN
ncbi:MAG: DUF4854 domain-containing protein [Butyrivibrio sp.]|nr:DUF4854 domain-containing protein [Acetatifactor muris]MCM1560276.1 DUF4854 domain-containing protein [Butyrivibrio sp.]